jgi:hypothetical protein
LQENRIAQAWFIFGAKTLDGNDGSVRAAMATAKDVEQSG